MKYIRSLGLLYPLSPAHPHSLHLRPNNAACSFLFYLKYLFSCFILVAFKKFLILNQMKLFLPDITSLLDMPGIAFLYLTLPCFSK